MLCKSLVTHCILALHCVRICIWDFLNVVESFFLSQIKLSLGNWHVCLYACVRLNEFVYNSRTSVRQRGQSHAVVSYVRLWGLHDVSRESKWLKYLVLLPQWIWRWSVDCVDTNMIKSSDAIQQCRFASCWCIQKQSALLVAMTYRTVHW
jgi:hypothetical protein